MTRQAKPKKTSRIRHSDEYKAEALKLAEKIGISPAAKQLGLHESQLYTWRNKARQKESSSEAEQRLQVENTRLKRQLAEREEELAILKKAAAYFAKNQK
jgi:transposase